MDAPAEPGFDELTRLAAAALGTASAAVTLVDDTRQWFMARHNVPVSEISLGQSFCAHAVDACDTLVVPDMTKDARFSQNPFVTCEGGVRFYAGVPLVLASGHCIGALCVMDPEPRIGLSDQQRGLLADLAKTATGLIETRTARQTAQIAARIIETTADAVLSVNNRGEITFWSRGAEQMLGLSAADAIGRRLDIILPPALAARHHDAFKRAVAGGPTTLIGTSVELSAIRSDGSEFPIEFSLARWGDGEDDGGFAAIVRDISERRQLELDRQHTRTFLDHVIANLPAMLFVKDAVTREYLLVNRTGEHLMGRPAAEIVGRTDADLWPKYSQRYEQVDAQALAGLAVSAFEGMHVRDDGVATHSRSKLIVIDGPDRPRQYILGMLEDITETRKAEAEVLRLAHFDSLTGLVNRDSYVDRLHRLVEAKVPIAMLSIDLDRFKAVNDQFGHLLGDEVLTQVGERLRDIVSPSDIVARVGGDEFSAILIGRQPRDRAQRIARTVVARLSEPFYTDRATAHIGASIGIVLAPDDAGTTNELRRCADLALYRAKAEGRGTVRSFSAEMDAEARDKQALEGDLRIALATGTIDLRYQPVMSVENGQMSSVEALARWTHPTRGPVRPDVFIPLAEECGIIGELGEQILRKACTDALSWPADLRVAVNLSPLQFQTNDLYEIVRDVLAATGLPARRLQLEVTEGLVIRDVDRTFIVLEQLRSLGIHILMDDFGVGYSSLSYFERFPFDKVKIDKSFVNGIGKTRSSKAIIRAVIGLGQELGMGIVAEGVETQDQAQMLVELGCTHLQGFLYSKALPASHITALTKQRDAVRSYAHRSDTLTK